jgi:hypothetical protein
MFLVYTSYLQGLSVNEGQSITIQCPFGYTISILNGWYGRQDAVTFLSIAMLNTNCYLDITSTLQNSFNGQIQNSVNLSNSYTGNDPCPGTKKYAIISYSKLCFKYKEYYLNK